MDLEVFNGKTGRPIQASGGAYFTFEPKYLPLRIEYNDRLVNALSDALVSLGNLSGMGSRISNPHLLIRPYLNKEAIMSSKIEGTRTTLSELFINDAGEDVNDKDDLQEVLNYIKALELGIQRVKDAPITQDLIMELHKVLLSGVRGEGKEPGKYRSHQNWIGKSNDIMEADFIPPAPGSIQGLMSNLVRYIEEDGPETVLLKIGMMHYQFETIHPFRDGNGRIGRLLIILHLIRKQLLYQPLLFISAYFERNRDSYYDRLLNVSKKGEIEEYLRFFMEGVRVQSNDALERTFKLEKYKNESRELVQKSTRSLKALLILDHLFINPFIKIPDAARLIGSHYPTAEKNIKQLVDLGILENYEDRRKDRLFFSPVIRNILEP